MIDFSVEYIENNILKDNLDYIKSSREIQVNKKFLKRMLTERQMEILENILNEKDIIKDIVAEASYKDGYKKGLQNMYKE